jgi:hypothetical protein
MVATDVHVERRLASSTKLRKARTPAKSRNIRKLKTRRTSPQVHQIPQVGLAHSMPRTRSRALRTTPVSTAPMVRSSQLERPDHRYRMAKMKASRKATRQIQATGTWT